MEWHALFPVSSSSPPLASFPKSYSIPEIPNFAYHFFNSIFLCHRRWLWQIRSPQMLWWCKGSSCHRGDGDQVSKLHGLLAPQRVPYGHPNAAPKICSQSPPWSRALWQHKLRGFLLMWSTKQQKSCNLWRNGTINSVQMFGICWKHQFLLFI